MTTELRLRNQSQQLYVRALSMAWRSGVQVYDPSVWLLRDPEVEEKMMRDADIAQAVDQRRRMVAGKEWALLPRVANSPRAPVAVAVGTELINAIHHFPGALFNLAYAFLPGARFGRIHGVTRELTIGDGIARQWWVPTRIEDIDKRMYRIVPEHYVDPDGKEFGAGLELRAYWQRWNVAKSVWETETVGDAVRTIRHVYEDAQQNLGYGRALRETLGWWWYAKDNVFAESLQAVERFAQGILTAKVDGARDASTGLPNDALIAAWRDVLEDMRARHVLVYDASDQIEVVQGSSEGWQLLESIRDELRSSIRSLILCANLPTGADKGGSYALGEVQENSTEALVQFDRKALEETLTDDLLGCLWHLNYANLRELGIEDEKPRFSIGQEKVQDPQERATVAATLNGMGVELSLEDLLDQTGFRKPEPGEEVVAGRPEPQQLLPGDGGGASRLPFRRR